MKKTISMLLAVLMAAIAVCTFGVAAFADETTTLVNDDPTDAFVETTTKEATTKEATTKEETTKAAEESSTAASSDAAESTTAVIDIEGILGALTTMNIADILASEPVVTLPEGVTAIDDGDETTKAAAPSTTKKPAKVESNIPSTGSSIVVPAIALLALAAGTVAVVKTKKED